MKFCDVCKKRMFKDANTPMEEFLNQHVDDDVQEVCPDCTLTIFGAITEVITHLQGSVYQHPKGPSPGNPPKKKAKRNKYPPEEVKRFQERIAQLCAITPTLSKAEILNKLGEEFPNRLRASNSIRLTEYIKGYGGL